MGGTSVEVSCTNDCLLSSLSLSAMSISLSPCACLIRAHAHTQTHTQALLMSYHTIPAKKANTWTAKQVILSCTKSLSVLLSLGYRNTHEMRADQDTFLSCSSVWRPQTSAEWVVF